MERPGIGNGRVNVTIFCGGHYLKNGQIYLRYDFKENDNTKNILRRVNKHWTIMKR